MALKKAKETDKGIVKRKFNASDVIMVSTADGILLKNGTVFWEGKPSIDNKTFCGIIEGAVEKWGANIDPDVDHGRVFHDSNIIGNNWRKQKDGQGYKSWFAERESSDLFNACIYLFGAQIKRIGETYADPEGEYKWGDAPNILTREDHSGE